MQHKILNNNKNSTLRIILRTEPITLNKLFIQNNSKILFINYKTNLSPIITSIINFHIEKNIILLNVIKMQVKLILLSVFELDDKGLLLGRVEWFVMCDTSVQAVVVVGGWYDQGEVDGVLDVV